MPPHRDFLPTPDELYRIFVLKYGKPEETGWAPRRRLRLGYFFPSDYYEALVSRHVSQGCVWLDVGAGTSPFPQNAPLARELAQRCSLFVGVDPSANITRNPFVHEQYQCALEEFRTHQVFDVATLRMVVEHIQAPEKAVDALRRLLQPGGRAIVYTVNSWSPVTILSWVSPFAFRHPVKRVFWGVDERDTFRVVYGMNTRRRLRSVFEAGGFREMYFTYLDDCSVFHRFYVLGNLELLLWRALRMLRVAYPEKCLLGVYERV